MDKLIELLKQIQELAGVGVDALQGAMKGDKGGPPDGGKPEGGPPPGDGGGKPGGPPPGDGGPPPGDGPPDEKKY